MMHSRPDAARPHLAEALAHHRLCVRANMLLGDIEAAAGHPDAAIEAWKRIETQNPAYLALVADRLLQAHTSSCGKVEEGHQPAARLPRASTRRSTSSTWCSGDRWSSRARSRPTSSCAMRCGAMPTLLGLDKLLEAQLLEAPVQRRHDLELVKQARATSTRAGWRCTSATTAVSARASTTGTARRAADWETYSPRRTEEARLPA